MNIFELFETKKKSLKNPSDNPCWSGYHPVGTKTKNGRTVPNCVPKNEDANAQVGAPNNDTTSPIHGGIPEDHVEETAAWKRKEGKSKTGGLNAKGVASYRRENPGSKLQTAVTTKPSKLKPGSKAAKRRKSFCARMSGVKGPMKKPNGKPTRKALALRKWNCESIEDMRQLIETAERVIAEEKQRMEHQGSKLAPKKSVTEGSDNTFIITAKTAEGPRKQFRVRAQSERAAVEKFTLHYNQAEILKVTPEATPFGNADDMMKNLKIREQGKAESNAMDDPRVQATIKKMQQQHSREEAGLSKEERLKRAQELGARLRARSAAAKRSGVEEDQWSDGTGQWHSQEEPQDAWSDGTGEWSDGKGQWTESLDSELDSYLAEMRLAGYDIK